MGIDSNGFGCHFDIKVNPDLSIIAKFASKLEFSEIDGIVDRFDTLDWSAGLICKPMKP